MEYISAAIASISLTATYFNNYKKDWVFIVWLVTNMYWCIYDYNIGAYSQSGLFFVYTMLALHGIYVRYFLLKKKGKYNEKS